MDIAFNCNNCGQHITAAEELAGQTVNCPTCGNQLIVPNSSTLPAGSTSDTNDITFDCDMCGQHFVIDEAGAGLQVQCPTCAASLTVPRKLKSLTATKTPVAKQSIIDGEITFECKRCHQTISAGNNKQGKLMSCPSCEGWITVPEIANNIPASARISTKSFRVAPTAKPRPRRLGQLGGIPRDVAARWTGTLTESYEALVREGKEVRNDALGVNALNALRQIQASVEVGMTRETYGVLIAQASLPINDFVRTRRNEFPLFSSLFQGILTFHRQTLGIWQSEPTSSTRFWGGGFGLTGFLVGAAISTGLNTMMEAGDAKRSESHHKVLQQMWIQTSVLTGTLEDAINESD